MKKIHFTKKRILIGTGVVVVVAIVGMLSGGASPIDSVEVQPVTRGEVVEVVSETGLVHPSRDVTLAFERGGRVASIPVSVGSVVEEGDILVRLNTAEKRAEVAGAYARLEAEQIRLDELIRGADAASLAVGESGVSVAGITLENAREQLEKTIAQQDQLVQNAEKTLRSSGLQAYLVGEERANSSYSYTAPTISGTYDNEQEGIYIVDLYNSGSASGYSFHLSGLETGTQAVSTVNPKPLGSRGLFIQFPDNFARGIGTEWEVPVPNTRSSTYLTNLNAHLAVIETRDVAIKAAENAVKSAEAALTYSGQQLTQISSSARDERVDAQRALVKQMQALARASEVGLYNMTLRAPFAGVVTMLTVEEGEILSPSVPVVSVISGDLFELTVQISEADIEHITIDDQASVRFDAYYDAMFQAHVAEIAPSANMIEGVRAFEVTLQFDQTDERIRAGLSADIDIIAAERSNVLAIPSRAVVEREDGKFARTLHDGVVEYLPIKTGLRGSDGMTEILSGLEEGEEIITFAREEVIEQLELK